MYYLSFQKGKSVMCYYWSVFSVTMVMSCSLYSLVRPEPFIEVLHSFNGSDGASPKGSLNLYQGSIYGRTSEGGAEDCGVIFKISPRLPADGSRFEVLYNFTSGNNNGSGNQPYYGAMTPLNIGGNSILLGSALQGGQNNNGTIYSLDEKGEYRPFFAFDNTKGSSPSSSPIAVNSVLYGFASSGGTNNHGVIYRVNPDGSNYQVLHDFALDDEPSGADAYGQPTVGPARKNIYGMTTHGGSQNCSHGCGVIFSLNDFATAPSYHILHEFGSALDGANPDHGFLTFCRGNLYGVTRNNITASGLSESNGVLFALNIRNPSEYKVLHTFGYDSSGNKIEKDGISPYGSLTLSPFGILYGMTRDGGDYGYGTIFEILPDGTNYQVLASFDAKTGANPIDNLLVSPDGLALYGMTQCGGASDPTLSNGYGTVFRYRLPLSSFPKKIIAKEIAQEALASFRSLGRNNNHIGTILTHSTLGQRISGFQIGESGFGSKMTSMLTAASDEPIYAPIIAGRQLTPQKNVNFDLVAGYQHTNMYSRKNLPGMTTNGLGLLFLTDVKVADSIYLGEQIGYTYGKGDFNNDLGRAENNSVTGGIYSMFIYKHFYTLMVANLNWHFYEVQKNLKRFNRTLTSYPQGWQGSFNASSGYSFSMKNMLITPILGLNYNRSHVFSYKEKGERFLHLKVDSFSGDSLQSACGLRYSWRKLINNYVFLLNLEGNWEYEYLDQSSAIRTSFLDIDYAFTSVVPAANRNLFMGTVNLSTIFSKMAYELSYTAQYSPNSVLSNTVVAYLGYYF